jgi:hypothetical protein
MPVLADDVSDHARLMGSWQRQDDSSETATVWLIEVKGTALHIMESLGNQKISEFECPPKVRIAKESFRGRRPV